MRVLLIGFGRISITHIALLMGYGIRRRNIHVVDTNIVNRGLLRLLNITCYRSVDKALRSTTFDFALVCSPSATHYKITCELVEQNIPVFVEKPLTTKFSDSEDIWKLSLQKNSYVYVGYVYRCMPTFTYLKQEIDQKKQTYADLKSFNIIYSGPTVVNGNSGWRDDYQMGGGVINDYGPHALNLMLWFFGEPESLEVIEAGKTMSKNVHDYVQIAASYDNHTVNLELNWADTHSRKAEMLCTFGDNDSRTTCSRESIETVKPYEQCAVRLAELDTNVRYYLRGEEFSIQLEQFLSQLKEPNLNYKAKRDLEEAVLTDKYINHVAKVLGSWN